MTDIDSQRHFIASGSADGVLRIYDIRQGKLAEYDIASGVISGINLSSDGQSCLCYVQNENQPKLLLVDLLSEEGDVRILQNINKQTLETDADKTSFENSLYPINCSFNTTKEDKLICGSDTGNLFRFDLINPTSQLNRVKLSDNPIISIAHHRKIEGRMVCASADAYYVLQEAGDVDEHLLKDADLRVEGQTTNKKRCLEREYLPGAFLGSRDKIYANFK